MKNNQKFYSLLSDTTFKYLMKNKITRPYLERIIKIVCNIDLEGYELIDNELNSGNRFKNYRLDILLRKDNHLVNIEMNKTGSSTILRKNHTYLYRLAGNLYHEGEKYTEIRYVTQINFNNTKCKENEDISISMFEFRDRENNLLIEGIKDYEIYLEKYKDICYNEATEEEKLLSLFTKESYEEMEKIVKGDYEGERLLQEVMKLNQDKYFGGLYNIEEEQDKINLSMREEGIIEGKLEGRLEGQREKSLSIAKAMLKDNIDMKTISKYTNLSIKEIKELNKNQTITIPNEG